MAEYEEPEPEKEEREPPEMEMSDSVKFEEDSEREKVSVAVSPAASTARSELRAIEGPIVSMERVRELSGSRPSVLVLPAESEKVSLATEMIPLAVLSADGVKVAV